MTATLDLSTLPPPQSVEVISFEQILADMLSDLRARSTDFNTLSEADPAYKILEVCAYREILLRNRVNEATKAVMAAYAMGPDLDQIGANFGVARLVLTPANPTALPPVPATFEGDADFRKRIILSQEGHTTAGSRDSYVFHALSAAGDVKDVYVNSTTPGTVSVAVLSRTGTGAAPTPTLAAVTEALNAEKVRPLCDTVSVVSAQIISYSIQATLVIYQGVGQADVLAASIAAANTYAADQHKLGRDITRSGIFAAMHQPGVQNVTLSSPAADLIVEWTQAAHCTDVNIEMGGTGE